MTTAETLHETTAGPTPEANVGTGASRALPSPVGSVAYAAFFDWFGIAARNMDAMMKSRAILARGMLALNSASIGVAKMSVEQAMAAAREISELKTVADWIDARNCLAKLGVERMVGTARMLTRMAVQVADDATVPLTRRMSANFNEIGTASVA